MDVNLTEAARLAGVSRNTLYKKLKNGTLSASTDRQGNRVIDTSELLRVFGALKPLSPVERPVSVNVNAELQGGDAHNERGEHGLIVALQNTIAILKTELAEAKERERGLMGLLQQRSLPGPPLPQTGKEKVKKRPSKKKGR